MAALLTACPSPGGGDPGQTVKPVTPGKPITPPKPKTYTTIVSGSVTTPTGKAVTQYDTATRRSVPSGEDAEVRVSTDSSARTVKAAVAADGSFTLRVTHPGTFTLSVDYPAGRDYKAGASQSVTFDHPGSFWASASFDGRSGNYSLARYTGAAASTGSIVLRP